MSTNYSTLAGIANTAEARTNLSVFSKAESDARFAALAGSASQVFSVATATLDQHAINRSQLNTATAQATEALNGTAKIATQSDVNVGTDDTRIVTAKKATVTFAKRSNNLSDLSNVATARTNLGLTTTATTPIADVLLKVGNLCRAYRPCGCKIKSWAWNNGYRSLD